MTPTVRRLVAAMCGVLAACAGERHQVSVRRAQLGTDAARLTGVFATASGAHSEQMYAGVWTDSATLTAADGLLCVELRLVDPVATSLDDFDLTMAIDDGRVGLTVEPSAAVARETAAGADRPPPDDVIRGRVCTPDRPAHRVDLDLVHRRLTWRRGGDAEPRHYRLLLRWTVRD